MTLFVLQATFLRRCWPLYEIWTTLVGKGPQALQLAGIPGGCGGLAQLYPDIIRGEGGI